ncbi:patatin-like phospholipase family protein [Microvirga alba]|uniref:Patatin-like phospholipase family protein n=1 Tax=Microvirga alba TaxID=2791025 RepID=A0A931FNZ7_9HYPH|nr:patatin-like phospholipase family protein [Microvirga alba]MBF9231893.1 patatin-like phospholipase family protein [Microvirga alba]
MFDAIAFAGGGNRCYWQGGFWEAAAPVLDLKPKMIVGVSAGAWSACYSVLGLGRPVNEMVAEGCSLGRRNFEWRAWRSEGSPWPVSRMYRTLIEAFMDEAALERLKRGPDILIGLARKPRRLPLTVAIPLGLATYQVEKKWRGPVHPKGGRAIGFRAEFVRVRDLPSPSDLRAALMASASVPPFMPIGRVGGMAALDGGLVDNVPAEPLSEVEAKGGRTLVILSRLYRAFPQVRGRTYIQPSEPVPIGQFDITNPAGIRKAYEMGLKDGEAFAKRMRTTSVP